jgi:hypothetical protein
MTTPVHTPIPYYYERLRKTGPIYVKIHKVNMGASFLTGMSAPTERIISFAKN